MNKHNFSIPITFEKVDEISNTDTRFTKIKVFLMHSGTNFNNSVFSKEVIENAIPSLSYIPIVGFIENNKLGEENFSDHRYIITKKDGNIYRKYMGSAYGVILNSEENNAHFEERLCDSGKTREYLVVDGILWNMFDDSKSIFDRDVIKNQSMELDEDSIEGYEDEETGLFHFTKFSFRASCVLSDFVEPAMENSTIEVQFSKNENGIDFSLNDFTKVIQEELNNKLSTFSKLVNEKNNQGGMNSMPNADFSLTAMEQFEDIANIVSQQETFEDRWGDTCSRYSLKDIQENEVIVVDRQNNYQVYGFPYTMNGDKAEIDFACGTRKKVRYENYEEGSVEPECAFNFGKQIAEIEDSAFAKVESDNAKISEMEATIADDNVKIAEYEAKINDMTAENTELNEVKANYEAIKPKYDAYVEAEKQAEEAELSAKKDAEFAKFENVLADVAEFATLKERKDSLTIEQIESECSIMYTRKTLSNTDFSKKNNSGMTAGIVEEKDIDDGYVATKYGNIPVRK